MMDCSSCVLHVKSRVQLKIQRALANMAKENIDSMMNCWKQMVYGGVWFDEWQPELYGLK